MKENGTISQVVKDKLCKGCGTCVALCPKKAIKIVINKKKGIYVPKIDENCNNCGICLKLCTSYKIDLKKFNLNEYSKEHETVLIGNYTSCFTGYSKDRNVRCHSSSGGLVTQLLISALDEGIIDGAVVTRMKNDKPLEPEPFIAKTEKEIVEASKSKYCPVPVNILLKKILNSKNGEKFAVVGLPCHIHGIKKAEQLNKKLKNKIVFKLGIFCNHTPNFIATELYLIKKGIDKEEVTKLDYRGDGWPGYMDITLKNRRTLQISSSESWNFIGSHFFIPISCLICHDGTNEHADISFGDAWLPEYLKDNIGKSIIISRTEKGKKLLQKMEMKNKISLDKLSAKKVIKSQLIMLYLKKKNVNIRYKFFIKTLNLPKSDYLDYLIAAYLFLSYYLFSSLFLRKTLNYIPFKIIWLYGVFFNIICSKKAKKEFKRFL